MKIKITRGKIVIIGLSVLLLVVIIVKLMSEYTYMTSDVDTGFYVDKNSIVEPVLQVGEYYLNGDTASCYFKIMPDNMMQFCGTESQLFEHIKQRYPFYEKEVENSESKSEMDNYINYNIEFWKEPHKYKVETLVYPNETSTRVWATIDSEVSGDVSLEYIDSETLGYYGEFKLIDAKDE